ncbi:MAG TPA: histidinol phosphate phosphatase domain-containing protein [Candidatus Brocadiia bacterium]|nr:histidinol phosphate phosphatase domain-containing protein [Candidatus Brocadiales bacterium]
MIDLHTHTLFSDGALLPTELVRRCEEKAFRGLVITDHVDYSNIDFVIPRLVKICKELNGVGARRAVPLRVKPGAELTHIHPERIPSMIRAARRAGAFLVLVHGETLVEPVLPGTNRAGIEGGADVIAHPGLISEGDARLAAKKGVCLEISGRKGHSYTNGYVAQIVRKTGAALVFGSDAHEPGDIVDREMAEKICMGAGLSKDEVTRLFIKAEQLMNIAHGS